VEGFAVTNPGAPGNSWIRKVRDVVYGEELAVGYRGYEQDGKQPLFPFGFGLSYTEYTYSDLELSNKRMSREELHNGKTLDVSVTVTNTGDTAGAEVVQVYVHDEEAALPRPYMELKGFTKVHLDSGESKTVGIHLDIGAFSYFNQAAGGWMLEPGEFRIFLCRWAGEVLLEEVFTVV